MKFIFTILMLCSTAVTAQEMSRGSDYKIEKTGDGKYQIKVNGFDSLRNTEGFLGWMNTGKGKPDGVLIVFDEKGRKRRLAIYEGGIRVGKHLEWYATGALYSETNWETDLYFNGKSYYKSGKLAHTSVNGNRANAVYTSFYENGQIKSVISNAAHIEKTYYDNGQIKTDISKIKRTYTEWHRNGHIKLNGSLNEGGLERIGKWSFYNEKGILIRELFYKPGNSGWYRSDKGYYKELLY